MNQPPLYRIKYQFKNGATIELFIKNDSKDPVARVEWSKKVDKKLYKEYMEEAVPVIYQKIADFIGGAIVWVDKYMQYPPKLFEPSISNR